MLIGRRHLCLLALLVCAPGAPSARAQLEQGYPTTFSFHYMRVDGSVPMTYILFVPDRYDGHTAKPLFVYMHGAGECGDDWGAIYRNGLAGALKGSWDMQKSFDAFVLCPQCPPRGKRWDQPDVAQAALDLVAQTCTHYKIEMDRVYITGLSMGAKGAAILAAMAPQRFAGIAVFSLDGYMPDMEVLGKMAVWNASGDADPPSYNIAQAIDAEMKKRNGVVHTHYIPGARHTSEAWVDYGGNDLYAWLLQHRRAGAGGSSSKTGVPLPTDGMTLKTIPWAAHQFQMSARFKPILDHLTTLSADTKNAAEAQEAKDVLAHVEQWSTDQLAQAKDLEASAPIDAQGVYHFLSAHMAGTPTAEAADARLADKEFQDNVKAWSSYLRMLATEKSIKETGDAKTVADPKFATVNRLYLDAMKDVARTLEKTYPNTAANREAQKLLGKYGITGS